MSLIRKHGAVLQAWACLDLVSSSVGGIVVNSAVVTQLVRALSIAV